MAAPGLIRTLPVALRAQPGSTTFIDVIKL